VTAGRYGHASASSQCSHRQIGITPEQMRKGGLRRDREAA
jgi:hypothetical protein